MKVNPKLFVHEERCSSSGLGTRRSRNTLARHATQLSHEEKKREYETTKWKVLFRCTQTTTTTCSDKNPLICLSNFHLWQAPYTNGWDESEVNCLWYNCRACAGLFIFFCRSWIVTQLVKNKCNDAPVESMPGSWIQCSDIPNCSCSMKIVCHTHTHTNIHHFTSAFGPRIE